MSAPWSRFFSRVAASCLVIGMLWCWLFPRTKAGLLYLGAEHLGLILCLTGINELLAWVVWSTRTHTVLRTLLGWGLSWWMISAGVSPLLLLESGGTIPIDPLMTFLCGFVVCKLLPPLSRFVGDSAGG